MPLYGDVVWALITINFEDGDDLDIFGYWVEAGSDKGVGWSYTVQVSDSGMYARWHGDNTHGGPELISVGRIGNGGGGSTEHVFRIHFNWYKTGMDHVGGNAIVDVLEKGAAEEDKMSITQSASHNSYRHATINDPYVDVVFDGEGHLIGLRK